AASREADEDLDGTRRKSLRPRAQRLRRDSDRRRQRGTPAPASRHGLLPFSLISRCHSDFIALRFQSSHGRMTLPSLVPPALAISSGVRYVTSPRRMASACSLVFISVYTARNTTWGIELPTATEP